MTSSSTVPLNAYNGSPKPEKKTSDEVTSTGVSMGSSAVYAYFYIPSNMTVNGQIKYKDGSSWNTIATDTTIGTKTLTLSTNATADYTVYRTATTASGLTLIIE